MAGAWALRYRLAEGASPASSACSVTVTILTPQSPEQSCPGNRSHWHPAMKALILRAALPVSPGPLGCDTDSACEERTGLRQVSSAPASHGLETPAGSRDPSSHLRCLPNLGCAIRERPYAGRCGLAGVPGGGPAGGAGRKGGFRLFLVRGQSGPVVPTAWGRGAQPQNSTPRGLGSPY